MSDVSQITEGAIMGLMKNDDSPYTIGTEEVAVKLGVTARSVRRLAKQGVLDGRLETTSTGKQWFFSEASVMSLIAAREEKRRKEKRHRTAKDDLGHDRGQPRSSEDMSEPMTEAITKQLMPDEKRVEYLEKLLEQERQEHKQTKEKLEKKEDLLLEKVEAAALLEGEKIGFKKYAKRLESQQRELTMIIRDVALKLQSPSTPDDFGQMTEDNLGRPETAEDVSDVTTEVKKSSSKKNGNGKSQVVIDGVGEVVENDSGESEDDTTIKNVETTIDMKVAPTAATETEQKKKQGLLSRFWHGERSR